MARRWTADKVARAMAGYWELHDDTEVSTCAACGHRRAPKIVADLYWSQLDARTQTCGGIVDVSSLAAAQSSVERYLDEHPGVGRVHF